MESRLQVSHKREVIQVGPVSSQAWKRKIEKERLAEV